MAQVVVNREIAQKVLAIVDAGLVQGMGDGKAGNVCVEAAVCLALGLPHSDNPPCVHPAVRAFKIRLNDSGWSSDAARTKGLRALAIAQLGSETIDGKAFAKIVAEEVIKQILPIALRAAASVQKKKEHKVALEHAAAECEKHGTKAAANAANAAASAADAAASAANAAASAADAAANAANAADAAYAAYAAASAADAAASAAANAEKKSSIKDDILTLMAKIGVEALQRVGSQGCQWLDLVK